MESPIVDNPGRLDDRFSDSPISDIVVIPGPPYPAKDSVSETQSRESLCSVSSATKNSSHDVVFDNTDNPVVKLTQSTQHTRRNKREVDKSTHVKARKYHLSEIENKMESSDDDDEITEGILQDETVFPPSDNATLGVNKMSIFTDGNINAGVTVTVDEYHSTYVDDLKRKQLYLKDVTTKNSDETIRKRKHIEDVINKRSHNIPSAKLKATLKQKTSYPIVREEANEKIFHTELKHALEQNKRSKQPLYNSDQVVQHVLSNSDLRSQDISGILRTRNLDSETIPNVRTKKTETPSYSQEVTTDSRGLFALPGQASQEDLIYDKAFETQQIASFKHNATSATLESAKAFPKLPSYEEALTFPSLTEYLTNNTMTDEIKRVLGFAKHMNPPKEAITTVCEPNTPPYTFFMPKQRKPPDKSEIPSGINGMGHLHAFVI